MASKVQEILDRIEKLKDGLQQKALLLEERDRELVELRGTLLAERDLRLEQDKAIAKLQGQIAEQAPPRRSETYEMAANVEAMTKAHRESYDLRQRVRELERNHRGGGSSPSSPEASISSGCAPSRRWPTRGSRQRSPSLTRRTRSSAR